MEKNEGNNEEQEAHYFNIGQSPRGSFPTTLATDYFHQPPSETATFQLPEESVFYPEPSGYDYRNPVIRPEFSQLRHDHFSVNPRQETLLEDLEFDFSRMNISSNVATCNCSYCARRWNNRRPVSNGNYRQLMSFRSRAGWAHMSSKFWEMVKFPSSLKELKGYIALVALDREGCEFLQRKCAEGDPEEIELVLNEIEDHICEFMMDSSATDLVQRLLEVCDNRQMNRIVASVVGNDALLLYICLDDYGTKAIQKLIEQLKTREQKYWMLAALRRITLPLTKDINGDHVIRQCYKSFTFHEIQQIVDVLAYNCLEIATNKTGCCLLQHCILHANARTNARIFNEIIAHALPLAEHPYGNYVVQCILNLQLTEVTRNLLAQLRGNYVNLSLTKCGSHVVETCLRMAKLNQASEIIVEMVQSPDFLSLLQSPYGNFVAQSAIHIAKGPLKEYMINMVQKEYALLHSHIHGKMVLALAKNSKRRPSSSSSFRHVYEI